MHPHDKAAEINVYKRYNRLLIFLIKSIPTQKLLRIGLCTRVSCSLSARRMLQIFGTLSACVCVQLVPPHQVASNFFQLCHLIAVIVL